MKHLLSLLLGALTIILAGCDTSGEDTLFTNLPDEGWAYTDTLSFTPRPGRGALSIAVRHDASYPYSNLWLEVAVARQGKNVSADTVNLTLCDPYGRWLGQGFGGSYQIEIPVAQYVALDSLTTLRVRHIMRCDTIRGIDQVGISHRLTGG
ncbi:MAG: gliding motility lipoprotein GldH [Duncaniella sp.]|nr:gliding motility lipoprotein GldH [Duncaniella sp.]